MKKNNLIEKLKRAVVKEIGINHIEEFVGLKPIINTLEKGLWEIYKTIDILPDEKYKENLPELSKASNVIYWKEGDESVFVRIAGLWWDKDDKPHFFVGLIYPP